MQNQIRTMASGSLFAFSALAVGAETKIPEPPLPFHPTTMQQSTSMDLTLHPAAAPTSAQIFPAATTPLAPIPPTTTPQSTSIDAALHSATAAQSAPVSLTLETASAELQRVARWVIDSGDNDGLPYLLVDKVNAQVFAFNRSGQLQGATAALLGMARGDRLLAPNDAQMAQMPPQSRITPAGRFVSRLAIDSHGKELLVLNYDASISLHAVVKGTVKERRAERLKSVTAEDNRISFGCINVPAAFYATVVSPAFTPTKGIVYVLPETSPASELFGMQPVGAAVPGAQQSPPTLNARAPQTTTPDAR